MISLLNTRNTSQKKLLTTAIILFVVLDFMVLAANFWLSRQIAEDAVSINLAGRQRMLSQRLMKSLLLLEHQQTSSSLSSERHLAELRTTIMLFDQTLLGFKHGGEVSSGSGSPIFIKPLPEPREQALVEQAMAKWLPFKTLLDKLTQATNPDMATQLATAIGHGSQINLELLGTMNVLTTQLERSAVKKADRIRAFQSIAFSLALLNFVGIVLLLRRRLRLVSRQSDQLRKIIDNIKAGILLFDSGGRIQIANTTASELFGYLATDMHGMSREQLLFEHDGKLFGRHRNGATFRAAIAHREFYMEGALIRLETISDITLQSETEEHLNRMAYHDALTGLPNRLLFYDRLQQSILNAKRRDTYLAVLFIDLDKFKPVNDTCGHQVGDQLLREVAARLRACLREEDTLSRLGGDEFAVLLPVVTIRADCVRVVQTILAQLAASFDIQGLTLSIGASIGIAIHPQDGQDEFVLLEHADQAMYQAKHAGGKGYAFYSELSHTSDT